MHRCDFLARGYAPKCSGFIARQASRKEFVKLFCDLTLTDCPFALCFHLLNMKSSRLPLITFVGLLIGFFAYLALSVGQLPQSVATHFDADGNPNQWMSRGTHLQSLAFFGALVPLGELGLFYSMRFFGSKRINIPNREYWLAPERREATMLFFFNHGIWLACVTVMFMGLLQWSILKANATQPAHLDLFMVLLPTGAFFAFVAGWIAILFVRFKKADNVG